MHLQSCVSACLCIGCVLQSARGLEVCLLCNATAAAVAVAPTRTDTLIANFTVIIVSQKVCALLPQRTALLQTLCNLTDFKPTCLRSDFLAQSSSLHKNICGRERKRTERNIYMATLGFSFWRKHGTRPCKRASALIKRNNLGTCAQAA